MDYNHSKEDKKSFLNIFKDTETKYYYNRYKTKKKSGAYREICAPDDVLKEIQKELSIELQNLWSDYFDRHTHITGFVPGRSIMNNALPHLQSEWVVNIDIKDFFPSVSRSDILNALAKVPRKSGWLNRIRKIHDQTSFYDLSIPKLLKLVTLDDKLPQGSPCSPVIANISALPVDTIVQNVIDPSWSFTRYADDITISTKEIIPRHEVVKITNKIIDCIESETCFKVKREKVNIKHRSQRQVVTGILVNNTDMGVSRELRNKIRAILHKHKIQNKKLDENVSGLLTFIKQVNIVQYNKLTKEFPCNLLM
jgi:RNA-directed DNA polymerase